MASNPFDQFDTVAPTSPFDQFGAPANPFDQFDDSIATPTARTQERIRAQGAADPSPVPMGEARATGPGLGEYLKDLTHDSAIGFAGGVARGVGGVARAPWDAMNIVSPVHLPTPDSVRRFERYTSALADDIRDTSSADTQWARDQLGQADTAGGVLKTLLTNPRLFSTEGAEVVGMLAPGGAGGRLLSTARAIPAVGAQVASQGAMAAGLTSGQVQDELLNMPIDQLRENVDIDGLKTQLGVETDEQVREWIASTRGADAGMVSFAANTLLPFTVPGGRSIERGAARVLGRRGAGAKIATNAADVGSESSSRALNTLVGAAGETVSEGAAGGFEQMGENYATFQPTWDGVGAAAALEGALSGPLGAGTGFSQTARKAPVRDGSDLLSGGNVRDRPGAGGAGAAAGGTARPFADAMRQASTGAMDTDVDAMLVRNTAPGQAAPAPPAPDTAPLGADPAAPDAAVAADNPFDQFDQLPVMEGRTWERHADADQQQAGQQRERELDALHDESIVPAAIYTAEERDAVRRAAGLDEAHPTAMQLAMQAARNVTPVDEAANKAATAPESDVAPPTEAQKKAGNYRKGHVKIDGLDVSIENPAGSERSGTDAGGNPWSVTMQSHYGYIKGTRGADGDHIDVFVRPGFEGDTNGPVFVIDQRNQDGSFDEHKVMLGFDSEATAREAYLANYDEGWQGLGGMRRMSVDEFKDWSKRPRLSRRPVTVSGEGSTWRSDLETADLPGELRAGLRARYESAERVLPTFEAGLGEIAAAVGGRPIVAPLKGAGRASAKVMSDYGGDASRVADLVRGTVEVPLQTDADAVVEQLRARYGEPVKLKDSMDPGKPAPFANGYRDINSVWMIDGEPVEVQINVPEMLAAKEKAHPLYEEWQNLDRRLTNERLSEDEVAAIEAEKARLDERQAEIYQPAWEAATRRMNSSREISSASSRNSVPETRAPSGQVRLEPRSSVASLPSGITPNTALGLNSGSDAGGGAGDVGIGTTSDAILPQPDGRGWEMFSPDSGSLGIPRSQMPQIKGEHRDAFIRFLASRGIRSQPGEIKASSLKPTQADYSPAMVARFLRTGPIGERSVLVSSDGHVLDGHHQWMASHSTGTSVPVVRLDAPIRELLDAANAFPHVQRSAGSDTVAGRAPIRPRQAGRSDVAYTASNEPVEFAYALVDDGALIASNETDGRINPKYPKELQPRDRSTAESRAQVQAIAGNLTPERLGESGDIVNGAPLVGPDGVVESGNGRVMALRSAPASRRAAYRQWLQGNAERFGLDPAQVAASDAPVLVRIRQGDLPMSERARLGMEGNRSTQQAMNPIEIARADARVIDDEMMALFEPSENGDVLAASNQPFLHAFAREIGGMEAAGLSSGGRWTKQMADRVNAAVFYRAYGDERLLSAFAAEADPDMKNILTALGRSARDFALARSEGAVEQGMDAGALLASAVQTLSDARSRDMRIGEYLAQGALLGDGPSAQVGQLATWLADNARRHRRLSDTLSDIGREIRNELASRQSGDMFGRTDRSLESIFDERIQDQQAESRSGVRESATEFGRADEPGDRADERGAAGKRAPDAVPGFRLAAPRGSIDAGARRDVTPQSGAQASLIPPATGREIVDDAVRKADDRLKGRDRPAAKPHEGDGELLAGPRPEQVDVEAEAPARTLKAELPKTDQANYGNTRPLLDPQQRRDAASAEAPDNGRGPAPIRGQIDMFVVQRGAPAPTDAGRTRAEPATQVDTDTLTRELGPSARLVTTGEVHTGIEQVTQWQDAAHIVAPLRKSPQEVVAALVLDENNRPLAVIRHSVGKAAEASVEPWSLVGAVMSVPGARSVYFAHNHPSGDVTQSRADRGITGALGELMHDSGVKPKGMIVVGPGSTKASFIPFNVTTRPEVTDAVPAAARNKGAVPVKERALRRIGKGTGKRVTNPQSLIAQADQLFDGESGIVLLDNKHVPQATLQLSKKEMGQLRRGDPSQGVGRILSALSGANTNTAVVYGPAGREAANLVNMLHAADVRVLDHIVKKGGKWTSSAETPGGIPVGPGLFLSRSRSGPPARGIEPALLRTRINQMTASWKGDVPKVVVVDSPAGLPAWARYSPAHVDAEGMYDPQSGTVYLVASNLPGMARARQVLAHEAVGHHGIEAIVGPEMWAQFAADVAAMRRDGRHRKLFEDIDSRYPDASEAVLLRETVAVMAERGIGRTWVDRMVAAVRRWLVDMGLAEGMTEDRIRQAIIAANRHVRRDEQSSFGVAGAEPAFSRNARFSRLSDSEVEALVEQYADVDGAPSEAALRDAVKQFRDTERAYGGRDAWQRAHDAGRTKLNYGQWVQVRTPNFKKWFGDWEAVRAQERLDAMEPVTVRVPDEWRGLSLTEMRARMVAELDRMVREQAQIEHPELGSIRVGRVGVRKTKSTSPDPAKILAAADMAALIPQSIYARSEAPSGKGGKDVDGYSTLLAQVSVDGVQMVAAFTVRHQSDGRWYYNAVTLHDGHEKARDSNGRPDRQAGSSAAPLAGLSEFVRRSMRRVNPDTVSKVVDPNTGEPLVVYHGGVEGLSVFTNPSVRASAYLTPEARAKVVDATFFAAERSVAQTYRRRIDDQAYRHEDPSGAMYETHLRITSPHVIDMKGRKYNPGDVEGQIEAARDAGRDGMVIQNIVDDYNQRGRPTTVYVTFNPTAIKSATGNVGTFDGNNPDIRFSRPRHDIVARDRKYLEAVESGDMDAAQRMVDAAARDAGYVSTNDYQAQHRAPGKENGASLVDVRESEVVPADYWTHPHLYLVDGEMDAFRAVTEALKRLDEDSAAMDVFRAVPKSMKEGAIRNGDWVSPSRAYAESHGRSLPDGYRIITQSVPLKNLYWDGSSIAELGVDDGRNYAYRDTKNNRKLTDAVTRDDDGDTIPLSKRFNRRSGDVRFSITPKDGAGRRKHTDAQKAFLTKAGLAPDTRTRIRQLYDRGKGYVQDLVRAARDGDEIRQSTVDRFHGIRAAYTATGHTDMLSMDGYMSARLSTGLPAIMEAVMMHGAPQWADGVLAIKDGTKGLLTALDPVQDRLDDWLGWMVARRAHVLMEQGRENLMTREDIDAGLALAEGNEAEFMQAAYDYLTIKNAILDVAEQAGLIDPVKRAVWDHAEYIPFYRDDKDSIGPGTRAGLSHQSSGIRTLRGGETALSDPLGNIVRNFTRLIDSSLKNNAMLETQSDLPAFFERVPDIDFVSAKVPLAQVRKHLIAAGMTEAALETIPKDALRGMADMWAMEPPAADDVVRIMRDGKAEHYRVEDPLLLRSLSAFATKERGAFMRSLIWAKRILTAGATGTAEFVGANYIRDALEGWMVSGVDFNPITDPMRGVLGALKRDDATKTLMMTGSYFAQGHLYGHDADATSAALRRSLRSKGVKNKDLESFVGTIFRGPAWGWDRWTHIQSSMEHGSRWAAYESAMAAGMTPKQAAFNAKDQFDFSMRGDSELLAFFTDTVPFLNARLQGLYKVGRAGHRNPKQLALRGGMLAMFSLALLAQNVSWYRDEYDELEEWDKDTYWHIGPGQPWHIRIPKPFELGLIFGTAIERGARAMLNAGGSKAGEDTSKLWGSALRGVRDTLAMNPVPQGVLPLLELATNTNTFTGRMIETPADQSRLPEARHNWRTSDTAKLMPASVSNVTGLSPKRVEHLWRAYTAGLGGYAIRMSDWLVRQVQDAPDRPAWHLRDYPGAGRFVRGDAPARSTSYQTEFWDNLKEAEKVENTVKEYLARAVRENRPDLRKRALDKIEKHGDLLGPASYRRGAKAGVSFGMPTYLRRVSRQAQALSAQEERIVMSRELSKKEKREQIDEMLRQRNALMAEAVEMIRAYGDQNPSQAPN